MKVGVGVHFVLALWGALGLAAGAHARAPQPGLNWVRLPGAEACLGARAVAERVEARLGRLVFGPPAEAELFVDGVVEPREGAGFRVRLWIADREGNVLGERMLETAEPDCHGLDAAITLVIAITLYPKSELGGAGIALDPNVTSALDALFADEPSELDPAELGQAGSADAQPAPRPAQSPAPSHAPPRAPSEVWHVGIDLEGQLLWGMVPGVLPGVAAIVGLEHADAIRAELGASLWPSHVVPAADGSGQLALKPWLLEARLCTVRLDALLGLRVCAGARMGAMRRSSSGFAYNGRARRDLIVEAVLGLLWRRPLVAGLHYRAALVVGVPFAQREYLYSTPTDRERVLYRAPAANGQLTAGLGWDF